MRALVCTCTVRVHAYARSVADPGWGWGGQRQDRQARRRRRRAVGFCGPAAARCLRPRRRAHGLKVVEHGGADAKLLLHLGCRQDEGDSVASGPARHRACLQAELSWRGGEQPVGRGRQVRAAIGAAWGRCLAAGRPTRVNSPPQVGHRAPLVLHRARHRKGSRLGPRVAAAAGRQRKARRVGATQQGMDLGPCACQRASGESAGAACSNGRQHASPRRPCWQQRERAGMSEMSGDERRELPSGGGLHTPAPPAPTLPHLHPPTHLRMSSFNNSARAS